MKYSLCAIDDIADPGSRAFELNYRGSVIDIFVVHVNAVVRAYVNSCPHTGVNLEWQQDRFLDLDKAFIQCSTHDALFEIDSGLCIAGPCVNKRLQSLELGHENGMLVLELPDDFVNLNAAAG